MNEDQIIKEIEKALQLNSETELVECKEARGGFPNDKVAQSLSAFGNTKGGIIAFGIKENDVRALEVIGSQNVAQLQEKMVALSAESMSEVLRLEYFIIKISGKDILAVYIPECRNRTKPYHIKKYGMDRGAYIRDGTTDRRMTREEVQDYVRNAQTDDFDGHCADDVSVEDLDMDKIKSFLQESANKTGRTFNKLDDSVLKNIGVINASDDASIKATIAGYLIFAKERPQNKLQFERYKIRCVRYKGSGVSSDIIDKADIIGTLDEQIDAMEAFVLRNIKMSAKIVGTKRVERYEYPQEAIREIVANAVIHRDYRITETYTQINIFEDRIEVFNPGNLPPGVTIENIKDAQESRNRIIAARLNEMDYLEEYGRGIDIVFDKMREWGLLPPIFKNTSNSFKVILPSEKLSQLNDRQLEIWQYLIDQQKITRNDIENMLSHVPQATVSSDLLKMQGIGLVLKQGQSKSTYYVASF